jgi:hypothetical protein
MKQVAALFPILFLAFSIEAQTEPVPQVVTRAPQRAAWTVTFTYPDSSPTLTTETGEGKLDRVKSIAVKRSGDVRSESVTYESGKTSERWFVGNKQYFRSRSSKAFDRYESGTLNSDVAFYGVDEFFGFSWIGPTTFAGAVKWKGEDLYLFQTDGPVRAPTPLEIAVGGNPEARPGNTKAFFHPRTLLPVAVESGGELQEFTFGPPPADKLGLPSEIQRDLDELHKEWQRIMAPTARPF